MRPLNTYRDWLNHKFATPPKTPLMIIKLND